MWKQVNKRINTIGAFLRLPVMWNWYKSKKLWVRIILPFPVAMVVLPLTFYLMVLIGIFGPVPKKSDFRNLAQNQSTKVIGIDGKVLGKFYAINRTYVPLDTIPKHVVKALIATEDRRFYSHGGIDIKGTARAIFKSVLQGKDAGGGSTISQQLVKNVFGRKFRHGFASIYVNKMKELIGARRLERVYDKDKIIELYLNTVPFGENVYGIEAASERFYSKTANQLKLAEGATLIGLLKANTYYNPRVYPNRSEQRRNVVLGLMHEQKLVSEQTLDSIKSLPFSIAYNREEASQVNPHYLRRIATEATELLADKTKRNGSKYNLQEDGLVITTTIHPQMQKIAEQALKKHLTYLQQKLAENWGQARPWGRDKN
ncbi:MAG: penicillin-binding protein, partial [Bacteroidetes bacterium]|nr:penicillin-binding protein [Bacteroidota bacterium]